MKHKLTWQRVAREKLAEHLREAEILASEAMGETSVYHCRADGRESIAIALPEGGEAGGLIVGIHVEIPRTVDRRRTTAKPASGK